MARHSAGILLYRFRGKVLEVFLVHPGGPFWAKKDLGSWSIPKGEFRDEDPLTAAKREFTEETGLKLDGEFIPLGTIKQPSGKVIHAWALEGDCNASKIKSNTFSLEWPPRSGKYQEFPEVDKAGWFSINDARKKIIKGQRDFIERLLNALNIKLDNSIAGSRD
jgi:predicted NUDIX family NTP pyrophosphohydrolase